MIPEAGTQALSNVRRAARNLIYALDDGTIPGELEFLQLELERAVRRAYAAGCTEEAVRKAQTPVLDDDSVAPLGEPSCQTRRTNA